MSVTAHDWCVRTARSSEADELTALMRGAKASWGYPSDWLAAWQAELTISAEHITRGHVVVLEHRSQILGFYGLQLDGRVAVLEHLWVHPSHMRRNIGRQLLNLARAAASAAGHHSLVLIADPNAESFYLKQGAIRTGTQHGEVCGQPRLLPILSLQLKSEGVTCSTPRSED